MTGERLDARREAFAAAFGPVPRGYGVRQSCGEPLCVEPAHLYVVPVADNLSLSPSGAARGGAQPRAKLTEAAVRTIRAAYPGISQRELARIYGVSQPLIHRVVTRKAWAHVE